MPAFQNRREEIGRIMGETEPPRLLNIVGEAGIGKTSLLAESQRLLEQGRPPVLVFNLDLHVLAQDTGARPERILKLLIESSGNRLKGAWRNAEQVAGQVVVQLCALATEGPVYLMFDTTEIIQEDAAFWLWIEEYLVGPLVVEGYVRLVFAGRVPVPWRRVEVRRHVKLLHLTPLPVEDAIEPIVQEIVRERQNSSLDTIQLRQAADLAIEFSCGHPLLARQIAEFIRDQAVLPPHDELRLCIGQVVSVFVNMQLFEGVEDDWKVILWWAAILDWFDAQILRSYLELLDREPIQKVIHLHRDDWQSFFIKGIAQLRNKYTVIEWKDPGYRFIGAIKSIIANCLRTIDPQGYRLAAESAAVNLESLARDFADNDEIHQRYMKDAARYRTLAEEEMQP